MPRIYARIPVIDRVMAKVVADGDCWIWTGSVGSSGYGKIGSGGRYGVDVLTHRTVWEHHNGPIPEGLVLDHLCGVIRCCNPWHLEPVIQTENQRRQSARRTACNAGHTYTPESARVGPNGRECRICHAARERARRAALRAEGLTARGEPIETAYCRQGKHLRTPENTATFGLRITCRDCMSESARHRKRRRNSGDNGSGIPPSRTAVKIQ
jgi:hypothetical protein